MEATVTNVLIIATTRISVLILSQACYGMIDTSKIKFNIDFI